MKVSGNVTGTGSLTVTSGLQANVGTLFLSGDNSGFSGDIVLDGGVGYRHATACGDRDVHLGGNGTDNNGDRSPVY